MTGYDPQLLATFLAVEQTGSFTRAAARLGIQQPTVSQHIRRLEQQVGRTLVLRDTHSVSLTADGEAMVGFARNILAASRAGGGLLQRRPAERAAAHRHLRRPRAHPAAADPARLPPGQPAGRLRPHGRPERPAAPAAGGRQARRVHRQAPERRAARPAGQAGPPGVGGHAVDQARPDQAAAARRLPGAEHLPHRDAPRAEPRPAAVPQRLRLPRRQRPHRRRSRRASASRPWPPAWCPPSSPPSAPGHRLPELGTIDLVLLTNPRTDQRPAVRALISTVLASGSRSLTAYRNEAGQAADRGTALILSVPWRKNGYASQKLSPMPEPCLGGGAP